MKIAAGVIACFALCQTATAHEFSALMKAKKYPEAEKAVAARLAADPANAAALVTKTDLILIEGNDSRLDEAAKLAEQCIAAHPQDSECHEALGNTLGMKAQKGSIFAAMSYVGKIRDSFKKAVELDPNNFSARGSLLQFYLMAPGMAGGGKDKAQAFVADSSKFNPTAGALLQATMELADKNLERAVTLALAADVRGSEEMGDHQRGILTGVGHRFIEAKRFADAEKIFRDVMIRFDDNAAGYFGMGKALQEQGKAKEALPLLEKSMAISASAAGHYRLGKCWQLLGDKSKAISAYEKSLSFRPEMAKSARADAEEQLKALKKT